MLPAGLEPTWASDERPQRLSAPRPAHYTTLRLGSQGDGYVTLQGGKPKLIAAQASPM